MVRFFTRIVIIRAHLKTLKEGSASAIPWSLSLSKSNSKYQSQYLITLKGSSASAIVQGRSARGESRVHIKAGGETESEQIPISNA